MIDDDATSDGSAPVGEPLRAAIERFLLAQAAVPPRSSGARNFGRSPLSVASRPMFWAALGEYEVCRALARLGDDHRVFHAVPTGFDGTEIEHLVIGPGGVLAVHTVNTVGQDVAVSARTFVVAGHRLPTLRQTEHSIGVVERCLSEAGGLDVRATGVLTVAHPRTLTIGERLRDVVVLDVATLSRWLQRRPRVLSDDEIATLVAVAIRPSTWFGAPSEACVAAQHGERFEAVRREVVQARLVRQLWLLAITTVVVVVAVVVAVAGLGGLA